MNGTEFEYYHVEGETLLVECGNILGGRQNSLSREVLQLEETDKSSVAEDVAAAIEKSFPQRDKFKGPGTSLSLADPGEFRFSYDDSEGTHKIDTSLDSITRATHEREKQLKTLAETLRSLAGGKTCGNKSFYGLQTHDT